MLTTHEQLLYLDEVERRFRERTPATDILAALPEYRVGRSEMRAWVQEQFNKDLDLDDVELLDPLLKALYKRLRKEFPDERW